MSRKVRWGVLGAAKIARQKVIPTMQQGERSEVVAIAPRNLENAKQRSASPTSRPYQLLDPAKAAWKVKTRFSVKLLPEPEAAAKKRIRVISWFLILWPPETPDVPIARLGTGL